MTIPIKEDTDFVEYELDEITLNQAAFLSFETVAKLKGMQTELAAALAEFPLETAPDTGVIFNTPDYWMLRGRRSLALELIAADRDARQLVARLQAEQAQQHSLDQ